MWTQTFLIVAAAYLGWSSSEAPPDAVAKPERREVTSPAELEGFSLSPKLAELLLVRWADGIGRKYDMDESQRTKLREAMLKRWNGFLHDNHVAVEKLANEFLEMRFDAAPPTKQRVRVWAERMTPMVEKLRVHFDQGADELRNLLTPPQRVQFEADALKLGVGLAFAEQRLRQFRDGEFEVNDLWREPGEKRRRPRRRGGKDVLKTLNADTTSTAPAHEEADQILMELDAWERYVKDFILTYSLDEGQRDAALSVLSELQTRARAHRDYRRVEIAMLEKEIESFTGDAAKLEEMKKRLTELYGPIDAMFRELKDRIEKVPTAAQRTVEKEKRE